jgi:hypothetical protein
VTHRRAAWCHSDALLLLLLRRQRRLSQILSASCVLLCHGCEDGTRKAARSRLASRSVLSVGVVGHTQTRVRDVYVAGGHLAVTAARVLLLLLLLSTSTLRFFCKRFRQVGANAISYRILSVGKRAVGFVRPSYAATFVTRVR